MPMKSLIAIGAGLTSALLFSVITTGHPLAMLAVPFSMLPLFMVGLSSGTLTTIISVVLATALVGAIWGFIGALAYCAAEAVPAVVISRQITQYAKNTKNLFSRSAGNLIGYITTYGALLLIIIFIASSGFEGGFVGIVERQLNLALEPVIANNIESTKSINEFASQVARLAPGTMTAWWLAITLISLGIAGALLKRFGYSDLSNLRLAYAQNPSWLIFGLIGSLIVGLVSDGITSIIAWNLFQVLMVPFIFVGLMVLHLLCRGWGPGPVFIGVFYLIMFIRGWPMFLLAILGFIEQWVKLRNRIGAAPSP